MFGKKHEEIMDKIHEVYLKLLGKFESLASEVVVIKKEIEMIEAKLKSPLIRKKLKTGDAEYSEEEIHEHQGLPRLHSQYGESNNS